MKKAPVGAVAAEQVRSLFFTKILKTAAEENFQYGSCCNLDGHNFLQLFDPAFWIDSVIAWPRYRTDHRLDSSHGISFVLGVAFQVECGLCACLKVCTA
jgi:hypothetical protein